MDRGGFSRRAALAGGGALVATGAFGQRSRAGTAFSWERLQADALALAARPYRAPPPPPAAARAIGYDDRDAIVFRPAHELLRRPGQAGVRLFPIWRMAARPVGIATVADGRATPVTFDRAMFDGAAAIPPGAEGFAGFRAMTPDGSDDWLAFQGASYFRASGPQNQYGLSMRALAIDTGLSSPEEFPDFTRFWLEDGPDGALTVHALLDSPSVAGAWRLVNRRTPTGTVQEVTATMRFRRRVERLGLAPCTSMFWYGEGNRPQAVDWRPEIHDSDGLAIRTGTGERIWRPLNNPAGVIASSFADRNPKGFGLLQRDRAFDHYQDDGVWYERRPSLWVEPLGSWGQGSVTLVELPTTRETADNIVAFWRPERSPAAGERLDIQYRLHWTANEPAPPPGARVIASWRGVAGPPGSDPLPDATRLVADFVGPALAPFTRQGQVDADVQLGRGKPIHVVAYPVGVAAGHWRLIVDVADPGAAPLELRAFLHAGRDALTETLAYQFVSAQQR